MDKQDVIRLAQQDAALWQQRQSISEEEVVSQAIKDAEGWQTPPELSEEEIAERGRALKSQAAFMPGMVLPEYEGMEPPEEGLTEPLSWKEQVEQEAAEREWGSHIKDVNLKRKGKAAEWFVKRIAAPIVKGGAQSGAQLSSMFGWLADNLSTGISKLTGMDKEKLETEIFDESKKQWQETGMTAEDLLHKDKASEFVNAVLSGVTSAGTSVIPLAWSLGGSLGLAYYGAWSGAAEPREGLTRAEAALEGAISGGLTHGILGAMGVLPTALKYPAAVGFGMITQPGNLEEKIKSGAVWAALMPGGKRVSTREFLDAYPKIKNRLMERDYIRALQTAMPGVTAKQLRAVGGAKKVFDSALWRVTDIVGKPESWERLGEKRPQLPEADRKAMIERELSKLEPDFLAGELGAVMKPGVSERERVQALYDEAKRPVETTIRVEPRADGTVDIRIVPTGEQVKKEDVAILQDLAKERTQLQGLFEQGKIGKDVLESHDQLSKTIRDSLSEQYEAPAYQITEALEKNLPRGLTTEPTPEVVKSGVRSKDFTIKADRAAEEVSKIHSEQGGSTINLSRGSLGRREGYAVSLYPEISEVIPGKDISPGRVRKFIEKNSELLKDPRLSIGTWYDKESGKSYLDVSAVIKDRDRAVELGKRYNQKAVMNLKNFEEIPTGGTGESQGFETPMQERLRVGGGETQTLYHFSPLEGDTAIIDPHAMGKGKMGAEGKQLKETGEIASPFLLKSNWYSPTAKTIEPHKWVGKNLYRVEVPKDELLYVDKPGMDADIKAAEAGKMGWFSKSHGQGRLIVPVEAEKVGAARFNKSTKVSGKNVMEFIETGKPEAGAAAEHAGAGGWSPEALSRGKTVEFVTYNGKNGKVTPIPGVEAVDTPAGSNEVKAQIDKTNGKVTILDKGKNVKHITNNQVSKAVQKEYQKLTDKINKARKKTEFPYETEEFQQMLERQEELKRQVEPEKVKEKLPPLFDKGETVTRGGVDYEVVDVKGDKYKFRNKERGTETGYIERDELQGMGFTRGAEKERTVRTTEQRKQQRMEKVEELVEEGKLKAEAEEPEYDVEAVRASMERIEAARAAEKRVEELAETEPEKIAQEVPEVSGGIMKKGFAYATMEAPREVMSRLSQKSGTLSKMIRNNFDGSRLHKPSTIRGQFEKAGLKPDDDIMRALEQDYAYKKAQTARGHVERLVKNLRDAGVREEIINSTKIMDRHRIEDVVKVKREADGTQSVVIRQDTLDWIKKNCKAKDRLPWMRKFSKRWLKKQAGAFANLFEVPQLFFERIGLKPIIYDPIRAGERAAEVLKRETKKEVEDIFKGISKKGRQRIFDFLSSKQGKAEDMKKAGISPPKLSDLSTREQLAIVKWRRFLKKYSPRVLDLAKKHGRTVREIESYFPMYTKDNIVFVDGANFYDVIARKDPFFKSLLERDMNVPYTLYERDAFKNAGAFAAAMSNFLEIGKRSMRVKYLIDSTEFRDMVGGEASKYIAEWYKNIVNPDIPKFPAVFRRWAYRAYLGLNPIVTAKQGISFVDVMMTEKTPLMLSKDVKQIIKRLEKPTVTERVPEIAVADMKSKGDRALLAGITIADKLFAKGAYNRVLGAELMQMKKEGVRFNNKTLREAVRRVSDRIDLAMGGMTRAQRPKAYRSEVGKFALMFTSTINSRFQYYIKNAVEGIQDKDSIHVAKTLTAFALGAYLEAAISRMSLDWSDAEDMKSDIIKTAAGNIPPMAGLIYALDSGAWMPSAALKNISDVFKYSKRWTETGKQGAPKALFTIAEVFGLPKQVGKVYEGLEAIDKGVKVAGDKRIELDSDVEKVRALIKGKWGSLGAQRYFTEVEEKQDWHKEIAKRLSKIEGKYFRGRIKNIKTSSFKKNFWGYVGALPDEQKKEIKEIIRLARKREETLNWTSILNYLKRYIGE